MSENLLYQACSNVTQFLSARLPAWVNRSAAGGSPQDTADALALVLAWPSQLRQLQDSLWRQATTGKIDHFQRAGETFLALVDDQLRVLELLGEVARRHEQQGEPVRRAAELARVLTELKQVRAAFQEGWPWINEEVLAESRAEYARGEAQSVEEILDELQGKRP